MKPVQFEWDGEAMVPLSRFAPLCNKQFVVHESYFMQVEEMRSMAAHRGYFAALKDAFLNLREDVATRFPSMEHLRKWCLVHTGFCTEHAYVCPSERRAMEMAALCRRLDEYAVIKVEGPGDEAEVAKVFHDGVTDVLKGAEAARGGDVRAAVLQALDRLVANVDRARDASSWIVRVKVAKSQAVSEMKAEEFKASKDAVLDLASSMIGVSRGELQKNAGKSA